ncbi:tyrosine-protein kinase SRK2 [Hydra vulgaris]|uniref:tyrosine-protein kinase SRK2 n=1 Tax=Hydra vulgaris TaxID=6087 RepID=UPI001F5FC647|nr:tyrosine-protein kinase SRK2 [Hydra vulgaris]
MGNAGLICFPKTSNVDELGTKLNGANTQKQCLSQENIYVALFNFTSNNEAELSFSCGEQLELLSISDGSWWKVRSLLTNKIGYIPNNYVEKYDYLKKYDWYTGVMGRSSANLALLSNGSAGSFLVRKSTSKPGDYTLSLHNETSLKHYHIKKTKNCTFYILKEEFSNLPSLVEHYKKVSGGLPRTLKDACSQKKLWDIPHNKITLTKKHLGKGNFGIVLEGRLFSSVNVAVKVLKTDNCKMKETKFLKEANNMKELSHKNLIHCYGVCYFDSYVYIVLELALHGALHKFLQTSTGQNLTLHDLVHIATQISSGMTHLSHIRLLHRDIAARNMLVASKMVIKIGDFGLSQYLPLGVNEFYEEGSETRFAIKWAAPETIIEKNFSLKSEVWSFGVVLYEIFTKGLAPYPGMNNHEALEFVSNGGRMDKSNIPEKIYMTMLSCWDVVPAKRPSMEKLKQFLMEYFR